MAIAFREAAGLQAMHCGVADLRRPRFRPSRFAIEMRGSHLAGRRKFTGLDVEHLVQKPQCLIAKFQNPGLDLDEVTRKHFAFVRQVLLHGCEAVSGLSHILRGQPEPCQEILIRLVKFSDVPHDVHVSDVIALPRINYTAIICLAMHGRFSLGYVAFRLKQPGGFDCCGSEKLCARSGNDLSQSVGKIMQVSLPWARIFPRSSKSRPSLVAVLAPRCISRPSQRTFPIDGKMGRTKFIFISSVV